jgi:hypothetical protein
MVGILVGEAFRSQQSEFRSGLRRLWHFVFVNRIEPTAEVWILFLFCSQVFVFPELTIVYSRWVGFGSGQGRKELETADVAALR